MVSLKCTTYQMLNGLMKIGDNPMPSHTVKERKKVKAKIAKATPKVKTVKTKKKK